MAEVGDTETYIRTFLDGGAPSACHPTCDIQLGLSKSVVLKESVTYIVAAVLINDKDEVLFMQEAKVSCKGTWYLPAGRVEANETLEEGVQREVLEETGLEFQPTTVIFIESIHGQWVRVTYTGYITGGKLKTTEEADRESLQAAWFPVENGFPIDEELPIRARDVGQLVEVGLKHKKCTENLTLIPVLNPYHEVCFRFFITVVNGSKVSVLLCDDHFPLVSIYLANPGKIFTKMTKLIFDYPLIGEFLGALSIEHVGKPHGDADGMCITCLVCIETDKLPTHSEFKLYEIVEPDMKDDILQRLQGNKIIPFSIRPR
ncbi:8-oxo-dGDP phosphatase NUDT18-like [Glandiceps talaboti]